jgi:hypothetical protein
LPHASRRLGKRGMWPCKLLRFAKSPDCHRKNWPDAWDPQQQISRLESPGYEGHSLSLLRRVAEALGASVHVEIQRKKRRTQAAVAEGKARYPVEEANEAVLVMRKVHRFIRDRLMAQR